MNKINIFFILALPSQTNLYANIIKKNQERIDENFKIMDTTLSLHYLMLSRYFNLYNYCDYKDKISDFENSLIYHIPNGRDDIDTGVEEELRRHKGKIPILMMSYDAHSPIKTSMKYMLKYHDVIFTYFSNYINSKNILFANISYDNNLVYENKIPSEFKSRKFACMILRRETREEYHQISTDFKKNNLTLEKIYSMREEIVKFTQIDIYGRNWPRDMVNYKGKIHPHIKKYKIMENYKFNIAMENAIVDNYLSEKILDPMVSLCVPVYIGSPRVGEWIPSECFVDIRDFSSLDDLITFLENMDEKTYNGYIENILIHRENIFNNFSTKNNFALPVYKWYKKNINPKLKYSKDFFDEQEDKIEKLELKVENKFDVFIKRVQKYLKRKFLSK